MDGADGADLCGSASRYAGCAPSSGSSNNLHSSRRSAAGGLGHVPFAVAPDLPAGLHGAPFSAMALDLGDDTKSAVSVATTRKPTPSSQSRSSSLGAVRVSKTKESFGRLPSVSTSKSNGLLPSLAARPGHSKNRYHDPLAWGMGDLSSSKSKWGSMSMGSL